MLDESKRALILLRWYCSAISRSAWREGFRNTSTAGRRVLDVLVVLVGALGIEVWAVAGVVVVLAFGVTGLVVMMLLVLKVSVSLFFRFQASLKTFILLSVRHAEPFHFSHPVTGIVLLLEFSDFSQVFSGSS